VIGSNSVVNRDLPARTICAGAPAKPIKPIAYRAPGVGDGEGETHARGPQEP
jgi:acetyltransferase-like isoleucine patch superfamily enzyme